MPIRVSNRRNFPSPWRGKIALCPWRTADGWKRSLRYLFLRFRRLEGTSRRVAGGMAIGVSIGMTPTVPFQTALALTLAFLSRQSKLAALLGTQIANPLLLPFIYLLDYQVGRWVMGTPPLNLVPDAFSLNHLLALGWEIAYPALMGGIIMGLLLSIPTYFLTKQIILFYRRDRRKTP